MNTGIPEVGMLLLPKFQLLVSEESDHILQLSEDYDDTE